MRQYASQTEPSQLRAIRFTTERLGATQSYDVIDQLSTLIYVIEIVKVIAKSFYVIKAETLIVAIFFDGLVL